VTLTPHPLLMLRSKIE